MAGTKADLTDTTWRDELKAYLETTDRLDVDWPSFPESVKTYYAAGEDHDGMVALALCIQTAQIKGYREWPLEETTAAASDMVVSLAVESAGAEMQLSFDPMPIQDTLRRWLLTLEETGVLV